MRSLFNHKTRSIPNPSFTLTPVSHIVKALLRFSIPASPIWLPYGSQPPSLYRSSRIKFLASSRHTSRRSRYLVTGPHCCLRNQLAWLIMQDHRAITSHVSRLDRSRQGTNLSSRFQPYVLIALCPLWILLLACLLCTLPLSAYQVVFAATIFPIPL